jgi:small subunit ribosomal protein S15
VLQERLLSLDTDNNEMIITSLFSKGGSFLGRVLTSGSVFSPICSELLGMNSLLPIGNHHYQQVRTVTKKRVHRQKKRKLKEELAARGIFPPKPPNFIPKDTPVINAVSKEERLADSRRQDELAAQELKERMQQQKENNPLVLRFGFTDDLVMSDRVRKLLDLHNGNQMEVVKAQKQQAMEIFQEREGDTGSSAVQVIALTTRIQQVQTHITNHKKDKHSKRGLDALYVRRRKLLDYMERKDFSSYRKVVKTLGLVH